MPPLWQIGLKGLRAITKNEGQEGPSVSSYLVLVTLLVVSTYVYILAIYALAAVILPGITIGRGSIRMLGWLVAAAFVGGLFGACVPAVLRIPVSKSRVPLAVISVAIPLAVVCFILGSFAGELGYGLLGSVCMLNVYKIAVMKPAFELELERRVALDAFMTIPLILELGLAFAGLALTPSIRFR